MHLLFINNKGIAAKTVRLRNIVISLFILSIIILLGTVKMTLWYTQQDTSHQQWSIVGEENLHKEHGFESGVPSLDDSEHFGIVKLLEHERKAIKSLENNLVSQLELLSLQLAQMQAKLIQVDSLSDKLIVKNNLNPKLFNLFNQQSIGGPVEANDELNKIKSNDKSTSISTINQRFIAIAEEIDNKSEQLRIFEAIYDSQYLYKESIPSGKPSNKGWISSFFGKRKDPFTGKIAQHRGIDVAGKSGEHIISTAQGVVTWAGKRSGYGQLIEISHGNNLVTRYGHCKGISVKRGQIVQQGDIIGTIGSTGRSTGPHIHYEVIKSGVKLNPSRYVSLKRIKKT